MSEFLVRRLSEAERYMDNPNLRPKDAATLLVLDRRDDGNHRVLMGRRHMRHRFMPGMFVFPGGRGGPARAGGPAPGPPGSGSRAAGSPRPTAACRSSATTIRWSPASLPMR